MSEVLLKQILSEVQGLKTDVQGLKTKQQEIKADLQGLKTEQQEIKAQMNGRFDTLETKLSFVQEDAKEIKNTVGKLEKEEQENVVALLKKIESNQQIMKEDQNEIKNTLNTVVYTQNRHEQILATLSLKSIEHESELNYLKNMK